MPTEHNDIKIVRLETMIENVNKRLDEIVIGVREINDKFEKFETKYDGQLSQVRSENTRAFVTKEEFKPIRMLVYGMVGIVLSSVLFALVALIVVS